MYCLVIRIESISGLHQLLPLADESQEQHNNNPVEGWLSYNYLGSIIQTKKFQLSPRSTAHFAAIADGFKLRSTVSELAAFFHDEANGMLNLYLCTQGAVLGTAKVNIQRLLSLGGEEEFAERTGKGDFTFCQRGCSRHQADNGDITESEDDSPPLIGVAVSLKREEVRADTCITKQAIESSATVSSQTSPKPHRRSQDPVDSPSTHTTSATSSSLSALAALADDRIKIEKEKRKWEEWRHKEEIKWHQKMKEQESAAIKTLEEQSKAQERERNKAAEASRQEFVKLETRLRKALGEVEKRERRIRTLEASREAEYTTKMAEVQLKERLVKEEIKHAVELEVSPYRSIKERDQPSM